MKNFTIIYRNDNGTLTDEQRPGTTKKDMKEMYKLNGYTVIAVLTESDIEKIKNTVSYDDAEWAYSSPRKFYANTWWQLYVLQVL